jgi:hypothetical protein
VHDIDNNPINYQWRTVSSHSRQASLSPPPPEFLPTQALDDASRRISLVYQNVIFNDSFDEHGGSFEDDDSENIGVLAAGT